MPRPDGKPFAEELAESYATLNAWLKPGDTVYCILRHVAKSGASRVISFIVFINGQPRILDWHISIILGMKRDREKEGVRVHGGGMDMGFEVVYELGRRIFAAGFGEMALKPDGSPSGNRPSTRDEIEKAREVGYTFRGRNGDTSGWDTDGGYALAHRWL